METVELRSIWPHEGKDFTPWLAFEKNLKALGRNLGLKLELIDLEPTLGGPNNYRGDLLCKDVQSGRKVMVENQLQKTDHRHLGQILTYAAWLDASMLVWIAEQFTEEHLVTVDWLNQMSGQRLQFYAVENKSVRKEDFGIFPHFKILVGPNDRVQGWRKAKVDGLDRSEGEKLQHRLWRAFENYLEGMSDIRGRPSTAAYKFVIPYRKGMQFSCIASYSNIASNFQDSHPEARVEFYLGGQFAQERFEKLQGVRSEIEQSFGKSLNWHETNFGKNKVIYTQRDWRIDAVYTWPELFEWYVGNYRALKAALEPMVSGFNGRWS